MKRLLFLASLSAQLKAPQEINGEMLHKLNKILELSSDDAALRFPVYISRAIWRNRPLDLGVEVNIKTLHEPRDVRGLGARVVSVMPQWMRYDDEGKMAQDVGQLLHNWGTVQA